MLGTQESTEWNPEGGSETSATVIYSYGEKKANVELVCAEDESDEFVAIGEGPQNFYRFRLKHKCACWNGCLGE